MQVSKLSRLVSLMVIVVAIVATILLGLEYIATKEYVQNLKEQIESRDTLISKLQMVEHNKSDTVKTFIEQTFVRDNKTITSGELIRYVNELNDSLRYYRVYYNYNQKLFNHKYSVEKEDDGTFYSFKSNAVEKESVESLIESTKKEIENVAQEQLNKIIEENTELDLKLKMYKAGSEKYNIDYLNPVITKDSLKSTISYKISAPKLDSALMLLPHYRKQLKYNEKDGTWSIGIKRFF